MKTKIFILMISFLMGFSFGQSSSQNADELIVKTRFNKETIMGLYPAQSSSPAFFIALNASRYSLVLSLP